MRRNSFTNGANFRQRPGMDRGPAPCTVNIPLAARQNTAFRTALWTGCHLQTTLMCIPPCGEIGPEIHADTDQCIRVEEGQCNVLTGCSREGLEARQCLAVGDAVFVPAGIWHNIVNTGRYPLKLSSVYAPPHHPRGTVHLTRQDAERSGY